MCFGSSSDNVRVQPVSSTTTNELPEYVKREGEALFKEAQPTADRPYPTYDAPRIAQFSPETTQSFDVAKSAAGSWIPYFNQAVSGAAQGAAPVGEADIAKYMNPYTQSVINPAVDVINRQSRMDELRRHGQMATRGTYLNEDRRQVMDTQANEARDRTIAGLVGNLNLQGYQQATQQANTERARQMAGSQMFQTLAGQPGSYTRGEAATQAAIGSQQEGKEQQNLSLRYEDFLRQFFYPQEQLTWLQAMLRGTPYETQSSTQGQQVMPVPNTFAQNLGAFGVLAGGAGQFAGGFPNLFGQTKTAG